MYAKEAVLSLLAGPAGLNKQGSPSDPAAERLA